MTKTLACVLFACFLLAVGVALRAAAAQNLPLQPGQITQEKVWVENRGEAEAVPVSIENMPPDAPPLRVQVIGTPTVMFGAASGQVGPVRQLWEYRNVTIPSGQDPTALLNAAGADGWEATGVTVGAQGATLVLMKRPQN
jgi:hypothetical protein